MMENSLAVKTLRYWMVCLSWNGRPPEGCKPMTAERALKELSDVSNFTGPARHLKSRVVGLTNDIIHLGQKPRAAKIALASQD